MRNHKNRHNSSLRKLLVFLQLGNEESRKALFNEGEVILHIHLHIKIYTYFKISKRLSIEAQPENSGGTNYRTEIKSHDLLKICQRKPESKARLAIGPSGFAGTLFRTACRKWVIPCRTCHNSTSISLTLVWQEVALSSHKKRATYGVTAQRENGGLHRWVRTRYHWEGRHPEERKAKPVKRSTVIWSLGSRWSLKSKPYGVTWDGAQVSPSSATPHFQDHHCSPLRETPLWASGLHTSGSPWGILGSE